MELLKNKWVLYGGGALAVIGAFIVFSGSKSEPEETSDAPLSNFSPLSSAVYGVAPLSTGYVASSSQESALPSFDATKELLLLENKKADNDFTLQKALADQAQALGLYRQASDETIALDTNQTTRDVSRFAAISQVTSDFIRNAKIKRTNTAQVDFDGTLVTLTRGRN
jgi:hypothetical protein